jgi:hypothetical protein
MVGTIAFTPYLIDLLLYFESDYSGSFLSIDILEVHAQVFFFIALFISSYQVYKSINNKKENHGLGFRFYIFQSIKVFIYLWSKFNLLLFFAIIGLLRIGLVLYFSKTKSFK